MGQCKNFTEREAPARAWKGRKIQEGVYSTRPVSLRLEDGRLALFESDRDPAPGLCEAPFLESSEDYPKRAYYQARVFRSSDAVVSFFYAPIQSIRLRNGKLAAFANETINQVA